MTEKPFYDHIYDHMAHTLNKHAHILFNDEDYRFLQRLARSKKKTLGELIRTAVQKVYGRKEGNLRVEAGRRLLAKQDLEVNDWDKMEKEMMSRYG